VGGLDAPGPVPRALEEVDDLDFGRSERLGEPLRRRPAVGRRVLRPGHAQGPLLAACLPSARTVLGTRWQPDYAGRILVLDIPTPPYSVADVDADLTHLRLAGCLDQLAALVLCRTRGFSAEEEVALHDVVTAQSAGTRYPVVARFEGGHSDPMPTWPLGVWTVVRGDELDICKPAVCDGLWLAGRG
jgi:muramoyltetrapeptide carboxypeptidase LdcA involved in peptidoglycan recycling